jgi:hypothetical protein
LSGWRPATTEIPLQAIMGHAVYQVEPNYDDTTEEIGENDLQVEGEMTAQVSLLNHWNFHKKAPEVLVEFNNRVQKWTKVDNADH